MAIRERGIAVPMAESCALRSGFKADLGQPLRWLSLSLALTVLTAYSALATSPSPAKAEGLPTVDQIIANALRRADWGREHKVRERYAFSEVYVVEKLTTEGGLKNREELRYEAFPIEGFLHERLVERDGRPISAREVEQERNKEQQLREQIAGGQKPEEGEHRMQFNQELIERYRFTLAGREVVDGRSTYLVKYAPKSGSLPVRQRMDHAMNKSAGRILIDAETWEITKVEFRLMEPVSLWWGILGTIRELEGSVERKPLEDGFWVTHGFRLYMDGRVMFNSLRQRRRRDRTGHRPWRPSPTEHAAAAAQK